MKNVLVTGGTGFIGSNLAIALRAEGCSVRILRRRESDLRAIGDADVEHCIGDVRDPDSVLRAMKGCDTVFHTAAVVSYWPRDRKRLFEVNVGGTKNIVRACLEAGVERLVHTSSVAAIGFPEHGTRADETNAFNWGPYNVGYRISKYEAEQEVRRGMGAGLPAVIVNPSIVIGPRDIHFNGGQIIRDIRNKKLFFYIDGGTNVVYVDDVVRGHIAAASRGRIGERYILCGENLSLQDTFRITAEEVGGMVPRIRFPKFALTTVAGIIEMTGNVLNRKPWITRELVARAGTTYYFSCDKARKELLYDFVPFREAARRTFDWYRENGYLR